MTTRRGLFALFAGAAAAPFIPPVAPASRYTVEFLPQLGDFRYTDWSPYTLQEWRAFVREAGKLHQLGGARNWTYTTGDYHTPPRDTDNSPNTDTLR